MGTSCRLFPGICLLSKLLFGNFRPSKALGLCEGCHVVLGHLSKCFGCACMQDGTIEYQIKLTGELSTNTLSPDEDPKNPTYGTLVGEGVNAQAHQHL